jgi:hypothetical protein
VKVGPLQGVTDTQRSDIPVRNSINFRQDELYDGGDKVVPFDPAEGQKQAA